MPFVSSSEARTAHPTPGFHSAELETQETEALALLQIQPSRLVTIELNIKYRRPDLGDFKMIPVLGPSADWCEETGYGSH